MKPIRAIVLALIGLPAVGSALEAQSWPAKPLHAVVPVAAGSTADILPRLVFERLSQQLHQTIIVENRTGAGGTLGTAFVAKAEPDGHTLLVHSNAHTIAPALYTHLNYDAANDLAGVIPLGTSPCVLVVSPASRFTNVGDVISAAKARPGAMTFTSVGIGTATHLSAERFRRSAGIDVLHVPYRGGAEAMAEVVAGRVDFFFGPVGLVLPLVRDGKLVPLAVNGAKRSAALPAVPTLQESGLVDAEYPIWFGVFVPARTPREIVAQLHDQTLKALQFPAIAAKLEALGVEPMVMAPAEFDDFVRKEIAVNVKLVKEAGLKSH